MTFSKENMCHPSREFNHSAHKLVLCKTAIKIKLYNRHYNVWWLDEDMFILDLKIIEKQRWYSSVQTEIPTKTVQRSIKTYSCSLKQLETSSMFPSSLNPNGSRSRTWVYCLDRTLQNIHELDSSCCYSNFKQVKVVLFPKLNIFYCWNSMWIVFHHIL